MLYSLFQHCGSVGIDSRQSSNGGIYFALQGDNFDGHDFVIDALQNGYAYAVVSKELPEYLCCQEKIVTVDNVLLSLQQLAKHHRLTFQNLKVLAITGTNGKTTTKELITSVLSQRYNVLSTKGNLNNHIGVPLTLLNLTENTNIAVIEMGASKIGDIAELCNIACPDMGVITNIGKAHLATFHTIDNIKQTKGELYKYIIDRQGTIFIHQDDPTLVEMLQLYSCNNPKFTTIAYNKQQCHLSNIGKDDKHCLSITINSTPLQTHLLGEYNIPNLLTAISIGQTLSVPFSKIIQGLTDYIPQNFRSQRIVTNHHNILSVDCYNANPSSMKVAIESFCKEYSQSDNIVILGDMLELGNDTHIEHESILKILQYNKVEQVYLVGSAFGKFSSQYPFFYYFSTVTDLSKWLHQHPFNRKQILLKASRSIGLEKLINQL